jgi:hypothetical protein
MLQHIYKSRNEEADTLTKAAVKGDPMPSDVFFQTVGALAVRDPDGQRIISLILIEDWRAPITLYPQGHYHPMD